jgi:GNAT superfamily N-acetyltransferase
MSSQLVPCSCDQAGRERDPSTPGTSGVPVLSMAGNGYLRALTAEDRPAILAHWLRLPAEDRRLRFGVPVDASVLERLLSRTVFSHQEWLGYFTSDHVLVGVAHVPVLGGGRQAELGLSVDRQRQRAGVGRRLMREAMTRLEGRGVEQLVVQHARENSAMAALCTHYPGTMEYEYGEVLRHLEVPKALSD